MQRTARRSRILVGFAIVLTELMASGSLGDEGPKLGARPAIPGVAGMAQLPEPYRLRDWAKVTRDYLDILLDFEARGEHLPLIEWKDDRHQVVRMPSFVGGPREPESINLFAALVSGELIGLDMTRFRGRDWLALTEPFFASEDGVYLNRPGATSGDSFWYDTLPNVLYFQLCDLTPDDPGRRERLLRIARRWADGSRALVPKGSPTGLPDFNFTGLQLRTMKGNYHGNRIEPEGGAAIAWMEYMAYVRSGDRSLLDAADVAIRALEGRPEAENPLYEVLLPYGVIAAARMNAEQGYGHDVARLLDWCFAAKGAPQARPWWGVISGRWGGLGVDGLVGSVRDGEGYAFAMNTFQYAATLAPLARYDDRYAADLGKWLLNLTNASRLFYANFQDAEHQSCDDWAKLHDPKAAVAYEGLRHWKRGASIARADGPTTRGRLVSGDFAATHLWREAPPLLEVFEEGAEGLEHTWEFDLPDSEDRWLTIAAIRASTDRSDDPFRFSYAIQPDGPYTEVFRVSGASHPDAVEIPDGLRGRLYVKVEGRGAVEGSSKPDRLEVDALAISYPSGVSPFAQGDAVVAYITAKEDQKVPVVLYRPTSAATDFGLYGSSCVGYLGGIVGATNVERILQVDLLRTDFFHAKAYPTFLYYNPYPEAKAVSVEVGPEAVDLYDAVAGDFVRRGVKEAVEVDIPPTSARVLVRTPAGGTIRRDGAKTLVNDVVVDYRP